MVIAFCQKSRPASAEIITFASSFMLSAQYLQLLRAELAATAVRDGRATPGTAAPLLAADRHRICLGCGLQAGHVPALYLTRAGRTAERRAVLVCSGPAVRLWPTNHSLTPGSNYVLFTLH